MISVLNKKNFQDVFYVENCSVNLLSISKLTRELNCEIIFEKNKVIFQDLITKENIGEGFFRKHLIIFGHQQACFEYKTE
jgi:hypothetical protein